MSFDQDRLMSKTCQLLIAKILLSVYIPNDEPLFERLSCFLDFCKDFISEMFAHASGSN